MSQPEELVVDPREGEADDPIATALTIAIMFVLLLAFVALAYGFLSGFIAPSLPRTRAESQISLLKNAAVSYPNSGTARQAYIIALDRAGQHDEAWREYRAAVKQLRGVEKTFVYDAGVGMLFQREDYKGAISLAKEAIASDDASRKAVVKAASENGAIVSDSQFPNDSRISILLTSARASGALKDWKTAVAQLNEALKLEPMGADLLTFRASAHANMGQKDKAVADYKAALQYVPDYAPAVQGLRDLQGK